MRIAVDFDNTLVCYDEIFHKIALEEGLIAPEIEKSKNAVRDALRAKGQEPRWTEMQGLVYGLRLTEAEPFPFALEFFKLCREKGISLSVISHKTRYPFLGPKYDLHQAATDWLERYGFMELADKVYFELSKEAKLERIGEIAAKIFVDDLPEFLSEKNFPQAVRKILFDPNRNYLSNTALERVDNWQSVWSIVNSA